MMDQTKSPKVAVITRTKNRNTLLKRALECVQSQTMRDFVQVVVNDGGDKEEVEKLTRAYSTENLIVIHNDKTMGLTRALNQGIRASKSEYIAILDDDDTWDKECLEQAAGLLDDKKAQGVVVIMDRIIEEIKGDEVVFVSKNRWLPDMEYISLYKQCLDNYLATNCFIYRRSVYDELSGYDESLGVAEDWDFGLRFLQKYDVELLKTDKPLAFYHHRPQAQGDVGNSVFAGVSSHVYHQNMLANKYLREDLKTGRFGVGYIINSLKYDQEIRRKVRTEVEEGIVRLEGHINYVAKDLDTKMDDILKNGTVRKFIHKLKRRE